MHCGDTQVHLIMNCKQDERRLAPAQEGLSRRVAELLIEKNNELNYFYFLHRRLRLQCSFQGRRCTAMLMFIWDSYFQYPSHLNLQPFLGLSCFAALHRF